MSLRIEIEKLQQFKEELIKYLPKYTEADKNVLSDYIVALAKEKYDNLASLVQRYFKELQTFVIDERAMPEFLDLIIQILFHYEVIDRDESYSEVIQRLVQKPSSTSTSTTYIEDSFESNGASQQRDSYYDRHDRRGDQRQSVRSARNQQSAYPERHPTRSQRFSPYSGQTQRGGRGDRFNSRPQVPRAQGIPTNKIKVTNIPQELLTPKDGNNPEQNIRDYFENFGPIQSVMIHPMQGQCIIEFQSDNSDLQVGVEAAKKAVSDPNAIFNNRFVKCYLVKDFSYKATEQEVMDYSIDSSIKLTPEELQQKKEKAAKMQEVLRQQMEDLAKKQDEQRRLLLANLDNLSEKDRQEILSSLQKVSQSINIPKKGMKISEPVDQRQSTSSVQSSVVAVEDQDNIQGEKLQERQGQQQYGAPRGARGGRGGRVSIRGASRGRGGRGLTIDNRPRTLIIEPYSLALQQPVYMKTTTGQPGPSILLKHLHQYGYIEASDVSTNSKGEPILRVRYSARWEAEKCVKEGSVVKVSEIIKKPDEPDETVSFTWAESNDVIQQQQPSPSRILPDHVINSDMDVEMSYD